MGKRLLLAALALLAVSGSDAGVRRLRWRGPLPAKDRALPPTPGTDWAALPDRDKDGLPDAAELRSPLDRAAFRRWLCALAERQALGGLPEDGPFRAARDCADLLTLVYKEALKRHDQRWRDRAGWTGPDPGRDAGLGYPVPVLGTDLFRVEPGPADPGRFGPSATAEVLRELNARPRGRRLEGLEDGDLLFFQHPWQSMPDHGMLYCAGNLVYHTGPSAGRAGRVKAVALARLLEHPDPRWRPLATNPYFLGTYRWNIVD